MTKEHFVTMFNGWVKFMHCINSKADFLNGATAQDLWDGAVIASLRALWLGAVVAIHGEEYNCTNFKRFRDQVFESECAEHAWAMVSQLLDECAVCGGTVTCGNCADCDKPY